MNKRQSIFEYLDEQVGRNPSKKSQFTSIVAEINNGSHCTEIIIVPGDGNCLIRSICKYLESHLINIFGNITTNLSIMGEKSNIILPFEQNYDLKICELVRELIFTKWDYDSDIIYHMDENAIDGLAIQMVIRITWNWQIEYLSSF